MALPADGCHFVDRRYIPDPDIGFLFRSMDEAYALLDIAYSGKWARTHFDRGNSRCIPAAIRHVVSGYN